MTFTGIARFGCYRLDMAAARLSRDGAVLPLPPKALAVLAYLVERRGRLVGKEELLDAVWGRRFVSEGVLKNTVQTLRRALADDPKAPRYIETAHRLGYRFIAELEAEAESPAAESPAAAKTPTPLVGREDDMARLRGWLGLARRGEPQLVFVTGEPGIGKTALIEAFADLAGEAAAHGRCVEQYGQSEPYLPVLEALNALARQDGERLAGLLRQAAPTWLAQLPWLLTQEERGALSLQMRGAGLARMLRELGEFLERWTAEQPLILVLEDLHWSDHATLDLLAYLARRGRPARWLILGSYRPAEAAVNDHPLKAAKRELQIQGLCRELPLGPLSEAAVAEYLAWRRPDRSVPAAWARAIHARTEGLPFFLAQLAKTLPDSLAAWDGALPASLPEGVRQLIEQQFERLPPSERHLLEAASVAGAAFPADAVAAALGRPPAEVEASCERLARLRHFLSPAAPGGAQDMARYEFGHAFYHEFAYANLSPGRRADLHRRVGLWLETGGGRRTEELAAELALHFERGRDYGRALHYLRQAAENAIRRHAAHEAAELLRRGLALLEGRLPEAPEHTRLAAEMYASLATALQASQGYGVVELGRVYERAFELLRRAEDTGRLFGLLWGIAIFHLVQADFESAFRYAKQLLAEAERIGDTHGRIGGHFTLGGALMYHGELAAALAQLRQGQALFRPQEHGELIGIYGQDPGVFIATHVAITQWLLGFPHSAQALIGEALARADRLGHPYTRAVALMSANWVFQYRREHGKVLAHGRDLERLAEGHGFAMLQDFASLRNGWALAVRGEAEAGIARIQQALANLEAIGARIVRAYHLGLLAEAQARHGRPEEGLALLAEALAEVERRGERCYEAELHRLRGELLLQSGPGNPGGAEACFQQALAVARRQSAKSWELRAATSLARLWQGQGRKSEARELLGGVYGWFTEGFDTKDLQEAGALLERLG